MNVLMIDNFDSFTFNLVDDLKKLNANVVVIRNDIAVDDMIGLLEQHQFSHIVISPGPGRPEEAEEVVKLVKKIRGKIPVLGICLGHQIIAIAEGGKVGKISELYHGRSCLINFENSTLMQGMVSPVRVARYHSLAVQIVPDTLEATSRFNNIPMIIENTRLKLFGVQFHPESILTPVGTQILKNFLQLNNPLSSDNNRKTK